MRSTARIPAAIALLLILGGLSPILDAAEPQLKTVLYGASYYPEYMPSDRLDEDVKLMVEAGLTVVRMGESTWTSWEPREGDFQFAWMDRVIDRLHRAGIKVILGTPTYSIPPWLYHKHPEIMAIPLGQVRTEWYFYGPRQNMDITNTTYLSYCERVIRRILSHFRDHPAVIGYQIDNETGSYGTAGPNVQAGFVQYLKKKFGTVDALNKTWGLVYWGQLVGGWEEFPGRDGILNPGYKLEWERYQRTLVTDFLAWQAGLVKEYKRPDQFVTQDFHGGMRTAVDAPEISRYLDVAAVNPYHDVQDSLDGWWIACLGDYTRSLKQAPYLVTETNAQTMGWNSAGQFPPYDGQLRLSAYSHIASGAEMVAYWHWHSLHYGQETYWKGLLGHDLEPNRVFKEASRVARELKRLGPRLTGLRPANRVAILHSIDSYHGIRFMKFSDQVDYQTIEDRMHKALYRLNVGVDFVFPDRQDFDEYRMLVVPPLYISDDALLKKLAGYVERGGHLVLAFKSGFCDENSTVREVRMPGLLRKAAGLSYQEFSNLISPLRLKDDPFDAGDLNTVDSWAELIQPETARGLAVYDHPFFGRYPAVTRNAFGKGTLTYEGTVLSDALQGKVLLGVLKDAGLAGPDQSLPAPVRLRQGIGNSGKLLRYYLNYSAQRQTAVYPHSAGVDLLTGKPVASGESISLGPWDLMIIEEK
jgi:beta-galactosidase